MHLFFLSIDVEMIKAICWAFIHSMWQGVGAAVLAALILLATRRSSANLRYNLLGVLFLVLVAVVGCTLVTELDIAEKVITGNAEVSAVEKGQAMAILQPVIVNYKSATPFEWLIDALDRNAPVLMMIWCICFLLKSIKIFTGIVGVQNLQRNDVRKVPAWQDRFAKLTAGIGVKVKVTLLESGRVKMPVAIGIVKPVILLPFGMITQLPPEQVETILLHELAHIRRNDYLVNILQRFAEAVFFFNPGLLWISSLIRQEREACCDDIVISNTAYKGSYLEALVSFQEFTNASPGYAMAIGSKKHYLLQRVKRMLTRENKKLGIMEKTILVVSVIALSAFTFIPNKKAPSEIPVIKTRTQAMQTRIPGVEFANEADQKTQGKVVRASLNTQVKQRTPFDLTGNLMLPIDTIPPKEGVKPAQAVAADEFTSISHNSNDKSGEKVSTVTAIHKTGKTYTISKVNDKVTSLVIDGVNVPDHEIGNYSSLLNAIDATIVKRMEERKQREFARKEIMEKRSAVNATKKEEWRQKVVLDKARVESRTKMNMEKNSADRLKAAEDIKVRLRQAQVRREEMKARKAEMDRVQRQIIKARKERVKEVRKNPNTRYPTLNGREIMLSTPFEKMRYDAAVGGGEKLPPPVELKKAQQTVPNRDQQDASGVKTFSLIDTRQFERVEVKKINTKQVFNTKFEAVKKFQLSSPVYEKKTPPAGPKPPVVKPVTVPPPNVA